MNQKAVKKYILEQLALGEPIQLVLEPEQPTIEVEEWDHIAQKNITKEIPDPDWIKPDLPDWNTVLVWLRDDEAFRKDWEVAKTYGAEWMAGEMMLLKRQVLKAPKEMQGAYKIAMEMVKTAAMWGDPKYSDRVINENKGPQMPSDPASVLARIAQLQEELKLTTPQQIAGVVEVEAKVVTSDIQKEARRANMAKARAAYMAKKAAEKKDKK